MINTSPKLAFYKRRLQMKAKEKERVEKKLSNAKTNIMLYGREKTIIKYSKKLNELDEHITSLRFSVAEATDDEMIKKASNTLKRWTGAKYETEMEKINKEFEEPVEDKPKEKQKKKKTKEKEDMLDDLLKSGALDNKDKITEATIKQLKKILKVDEEIRDELKEIKENAIDEQDTSIKEEAKGDKPVGIPTKGGKPAKMQDAKATGDLLTTILGLGLTGGLLAKLFNNYVKEHGSEFLPDWLKDMSVENAKAGAFAGTKAAATTTKAGLAVLKGAKNAASMAATKATAPTKAKAAVKKITKLEKKAIKKPLKKVSVNVAGTAFKRIGKETNQELAGRITEKILAQKAAKLGVKKIPLVGLSIALGFAYVRWQDGEYLAAAGEAISGVLASFPGIGTGASLLVDMGLIYFDVQKIIEDIEKAEAKAEEEKAKRTSGIKGIMKANVKKALAAKVAKFAKTDTGAKLAQSTYDIKKEKLEAYLASDAKTRDPKEFNILRQELAEANIVVLEEMKRIREKLDTTDADNKKILEEAMSLKNKELAPEMIRLGKERAALLASPGGTMSSGGYHKDYNKVQAKLKVNMEKMAALRGQVDVAGQLAITKYNAPALAKATAQYDGASTLTAAPRTVGSIAQGIKEKDQASGRDESKKTSGGVTGKSLSGLTSDTRTAFDKLSSAWGSSLNVVSAYRSPEYNKSVGGAKKSMHVEGRAIDISWADNTQRGKEKFIMMAAAAGFRGIGIYSTFIHVDTGSKRAWGSTGSRSSLPRWANVVINNAWNGVQSQENEPAQVTMLTSAGEITPAQVNKILTSAQTDTQPMTSSPMVPTISTEMKDMQSQQVAKHLVNLKGNYDIKAQLGSLATSVQGGINNMQSVINSGDSGNESLLGAFNGTAPYTNG